MWFHNFEECKAAYFHLVQAKINGEWKLSVKFADCTPNYYDREFSTAFESSIMGTFIGLEKAIKIPSDYVKSTLSEKLVIN